MMDVFSCGAVLHLLRQKESEAALSFEKIDGSRILSGAHHSQKRGHFGRRYRSKFSCSDFFMSCVRMPDGSECILLK
jgi:hypothetical protein